MVKEKVFGSDFRNCVGLLLKLQSSLYDMRSVDISIKTELYFSKTLIRTEGK